MSEPQTPNGVVIAAMLPDRSWVNITEGVSALYDLLVQTQDFGSGFFSEEDAVPLAELARVCGFAGAEEAERYLDRWVRRCTDCGHVGNYHRRHRDGEYRFGACWHGHVGETKGCGCLEFKPEPKP